MAVHKNLSVLCSGLQNLLCPVPMSTDRDASHAIKSSLHYTVMTSEENILLWHSSVKTRAFVKVIPNTPTKHKKNLVSVGLCVGFQFGSHHKSLKKTREVAWGLWLC